MAKDIAKKIAKNIADCQYSMHVILISEGSVAVAYPAELGLKQARKKVLQSIEIIAEKSELKNWIFVNPLMGNQFVAVHLCEIGSKEEGKYLEKGELISHA